MGFKIGDLVQPSTSEWAPPLVNGPYGEWIGTVVSIRKVTKGDEDVRSGVYLEVAIPDSKRHAVIHEGQVELVQVSE